MISYVERAWLKITHDIITNNNMLLLVLVYQQCVVGGKPTTCNVIGGGGGGGVTGDCALMCRVCSHLSTIVDWWLVNSSPWSSRRLGRLVNSSPKLVAKMKKLYQQTIPNTKCNKLSVTLTFIIEQMIEYLLISSRLSTNSTPARLWSLLC